MRMASVVTSFGASVSRLGAGILARSANGKHPEKLLELYEFEACPFCRKAREAFTAFDLDVLVYPCPKGGERFRPGKKMFPYLVDPNTGTSMYESMDIARYLAKTYSDGKLPLGLSLGPLTTLSSALASVWRSGHGGRVRARASGAMDTPGRPLELWSFEGSPYCRLVRETLCELELPYVLHNVGKGSAHRAAFVARSGKMMVPYLVDENTGAAMFESADIIAYLDATYGAGAA
jgi:glutathione S-transferase